MAVSTIFQQVLGATMTDTTLRSASPNLPAGGSAPPVAGGTSAGSAPSLWLGYNSNLEISRILLDFSIESLIGKVVTGSKLELFGIGVDAANVAGQLGKCRVVTPSAAGGFWPTETGADWDHRSVGRLWNSSFGGGDYTTVNETDFVMPPPAGGDLVIQGVGLNLATQAVLVAGGSGRLRLLLMLANEGLVICAHQFASREYTTDTTKQPKLTILTLDPAGSIKTTILPPESAAAGGKWSLASDATERATDTQADDLPVGTQTVKFKTGITNFQTPADIPVVVNDGQVSQVVGRYVATGSVKITLTDAAAITAGAQWRLDTDAAGIWRNSDEVVTGVRVGVRTISYKPTAGYAVPAPTTVVVAGGGTATDTTAFVVGTGFLKVNVQIPFPDPFANTKVWRGRWRWMGGAWNENGATISVSPGTYDVVPGTPTLEFELDGGIDPIPDDTGLPITITDTVTTTIFPAAHVSSGSGATRVETSGHVSGTGGYRVVEQDVNLTVWRGGVGDDGPFIVAGGLNVQKNIIFRPITGLVTPNPTTIPLDNTTIVIGVYIGGTDGSVQITLTDAGAIAAGAQWKLRHEDPGVWHNSDFVLAVPQGTYDVDFKTISNYSAPASFQVTVTAGGAATGTGAYVAGVTSITSILGPSEAITAGAQFKVQGGAFMVGMTLQWSYDSGWVNSGVLVTDMPLNDSLFITYKSIAGWITPPPTNMALQPGDVISLTATYTGNPSQYTKAAVARIDSIADFQVLPSDSGGEQIVITDIQGTAHAGKPSVTPADSFNGGLPDPREGQLRWYELVFIRMADPDVATPLPAYVGDNSAPLDGPVYVYRVHNRTVGEAGSSSLPGGEPVDDGVAGNLVLPGKPIILPSGAYMIFVCAIAKVPFRDGWTVSLFNFIPPQWSEIAQVDPNQFDGGGTTDPNTGVVTHGIITLGITPGRLYDNTVFGPVAPWSCFVSMLFRDFNTDLTAQDGQLFATDWWAGSVSAGGPQVQSWFIRRSWRNLSGSTSQVTETEPLRVPVTADGRGTVPNQDPNLAPSLFLVADSAVVFARFNQLKWNT